MFSHSVRCLSFFCDGVPCLAKTFQFDVVPFVYFFVYLAQRDMSESTLQREMSKILLLMFSSMSFMISGLTLKTLIHFQFILVYDVRWSGFRFLYVSVQFSPHHLLNSLSLPHCMVLPHLSNINWLSKCGFISGLSILFHWFVCFYATAMLFWLLQLCSIVWFQVEWYLQFCSSFSRLLWLFKVFCGSI